MYIEEQLKELKESVELMQKEIEHLKVKSSEQILTPKEFAEMTSINQNTVYTWIREGRIKTLPNLGTAIRIPMSQFYESVDTSQYQSEKAANKAEELRNEFRRMRKDRITHKIS